jgi:peptidoglycan hydrolase CwlO-like protein
METWTTMINIKPVKVCRVSDAQAEIEARDKQYQNVLSVMELGCQDEDSQCPIQADLTAAREEIAKLKEILEDNEEEIESLRRYSEKLNAKLTASEKRLRETQEVLSDEIKGLHHLIDSQQALKKADEPKEDSNDR